MDRRRYLALWVGLVLGLFSVYAHAAVITYDTSTPIVTVGDTIQIDVMVSGLGAGAPPTIGAFDLEMGYNPALVGYDSYVFGTGLGFIPGVDYLDFSLGDTGASVAISQLSLMPAPILDVIQPPEFLLATVSYTATAPGVVVFDMPSVLLSDNGGLLAIPVDEFLPLTVEILPPQGGDGDQPMPLPGSLWLMLTALAIPRLRAALMKT